MNKVYQNALSERPINRHFLVTETRDLSIIIFQEQYKSLRTEILQRQQRRFLIALGGVVGVPGISGLSLSGTGFENASAVMPVIVVVISALFFLENNAIARAGYFIETQIENHFPTMPGWEHYLHDLSDKHLKYPQSGFGINQAFKVLMIFYFVTGWILGSKQLGHSFPSYAGELYCLYTLACGILFIFWMVNVNGKLTFSAQLLKQNKNRELKN